MKISITLISLLFISIFWVIACDGDSGIEPEDDTNSIDNEWQIDGDAIYTFINNNRVYINKHVAAVDFNCPPDTIYSITINDKVFTIDTVTTNHFNFSSVNRPDIRDYIVNALRTSEVVNFKLSHGFEFSVSTDGFKFVAKATATIIAFAIEQLLNPKCVKETTI